MIEQSPLKGFAKLTSPRTGAAAIAVLVLFGSLVLPAAAQTMMAASADPEFEVATIKPSDPDDHSQGFRSNGHHISCENETVASMVQFAYGIHVKQIVGGPAWLNTDRYDIDGVPNTEGQPDLKQMQSMYRKVLVDRFKLTFHHDKKELSVYSVSVARGGPKLTKSASDPHGLPDSTGNGSSSQMDIRFTNASMSDFALNMQFYMDRPVVDVTELKGKFDFRLKWSYADAPAGDADAPPGLFTAVQEQLGLKLEATKLPADVFVIDGVERPSAN